jgi:hypothetical protein
MQGTRDSLKAGLVMAGLVLAACGGGAADGSEISMGGKGGGAGSGGNAGTLVIGDLGGGGAGGAGGTSTSGAGGSSGGNGGSAGTSGAGGGQAGSSSEPCTPASPQGIPLAGSCLYADHCTDEYDTSFGAATLQQLCEGQSGTWSTAACVTGSWKIKCTQEVFGGVYIQYMPADGICFDGCEEAL